jgi:hypothetical protein
MKSKKDVVFWNPGPYKEIAGLYRTLGSYKIAHYTRKAGYTTQVIDHILHMTEVQLYLCTRKFINHNTEVLAISTTFLINAWTVNSLPTHVVNVLNAITKEFTNLKIVFGGYNVNRVALTNTINKDKLYVISKFGEDIFVDLLKYFKKIGNLPTFNLVEGNNKIFVLTDSISNNFNIERDDFNFVEDDCIMPNETLPIEISRGCIFKCKFCNHLMLGRGKLDYLRDFELIKESLMINYNNWGITNYYVICDTFNDTEIKMKAWHAMVTSLPFKIKYTAYLRADLLDKFPDVPIMLKEAGLYTAYHGIESFGPGAHAVGKGWSQRRAKEYIPKLYHDIWNNEIHQSLSFIVGLPEDTEDTLIDAAAWFTDNNMFHVAFQTLGLNHLSQLDNNKSEFERDAAKFGYTFPKPNNPTWWENSNFNSSTAGRLQDKLEKQLGTSNSRYGSWKIMSLLQLGLNPNTFNKENSWSEEFSLNQMSKAASVFLINYIDKLLKL